MPYLTTITKNVLPNTPSNNSESKRYLDKENVNRLIALAQSGDSKALGEVIDINQGLIRKICFRYVGRNLEFEDLLQDGYLASVKAIYNYDVSRGTKFSSFLGTYVKQQMFRALENRFTIRLGRLNQWYGKFCASRNKLNEELKREPTPQEISNDSGIKLSTVRVLSHVENFTPLSFNSTTSPNTNLLLGDTIEDIQADFLENSVSFYLVIKILNESDFSDKKKSIFRLIYGIDDGVCKTLVEVGKKFNMSKQRVKQIEVEVLEYLKRNCVG